MNHYTQWPKKINKIMFIIVMQQEADYAIKMMDLKEDESCKENPFIEAFTGIFAGKTVIIVKPPIDPVYKVQAVSTEPAAVCLQIAIQKYAPDIVVSSGTCGGVKRSSNEELNLKIEEVVVAERVQFFTRTMIVQEWKEYVQGSQYSLLDPNNVQQSLGIRKATVGSDNSFQDDMTLAIKNGIDCIEMEAAAEARVCHLLKVPFTAIKIVSDIEMENKEERERLFKEFFINGIKTLGIKIKEFVEKIDQICGNDQ